VPFPKGKASDLKDPKLPPELGSFLCGELPTLAAAKAFYGCDFWS
jgi:hypothetical protein